MPKISLNAMRLSASEPGLTRGYDAPTYAHAAAQLPLFWRLGKSNFYAEANYFILRAGRPTQDGGNTTKNFQSFTLNYKNDLLSFAFGRQGYQSPGKDFIIYYGPRGARRPGVAPTALEGARHTLQSRYFSYDLLAGREVRALSPSGDNSLVYGGALGAHFGALAGVEGFYYRRKSDALPGGREFDVCAYGAGLRLGAADKMNISFYAAKNGGQTRSGLVEQPLGGHAYAAALRLPGHTGLGRAYYELDFYYGSGQKGARAQYVPIAQNMDYGYIYGGAGLARATAGYEPPGESAADMRVYAFKFKQDLDFISGFTLGVFALEGAIYNFAASSGEYSQPGIGTELDLALAYESGFFTFKIYGGFFTTGDGYGEVNTIAGLRGGESVSAIGFNTSFEFAL